MPARYTAKLGRLRTAYGPLEEDRRGRVPRERRWKGSLSQRVRAAEGGGSRQVVVKVTGHYHGAANVRERLQYIARGGALALETNGGELVAGSEEIGELVAAWSAEFTTRKNGRDATGISLSLPPDQVRGPEDEARAVAAARAFLEREFGDTYEYVFVAHSDTDHAHVHVIVNRHGRDGSSLRTNKADLARWRERFAEAAREQGFEVDASPRYARGLARETEPTGLYHVRERGASVRADSSASPPSEEETRARRARAVNRAERIAYGEAARGAAESARGFVESGERARGLELAGILALFAARMPGPPNDGRPGWMEAYDDVRETYEILRGEAHRLFGAELRSVSLVRDSIGGELEQSRAAGVDAEESARLLEDAARVVASLSDPDEQARARDLVEEMRARLEWHARGSDRDLDEDLER